MLQQAASPIDRVNRLLAQANLPVSITIDGGELKAERSGNIYSIARMSDGERSALVITAEVVAAEDGTIFVIDEPELHLHRAIVVPLLTAIISARPNCGFVVSTHELELAATTPESTILLVRGIAWSGDRPSTWEVDLLAHAEELPEDLRIDLLGSRRKILFVEGQSNSLDQPLYSLLFPAISVRPKDNCRAVAKAVSGLRDTEELHRAQAFGLIDGDGAAEGDSLTEGDGIFALPAYSVESLYYCEDALSAIAERQAATFGASADQLLRDARQRAIRSLQRPGTKEHLAARLAERLLRGSIIAAIPSREQMVTQGATFRFELPSPYPEELQRISELIQRSELEAIVARYPVREAGILNELAKGLRFPTRTDYELAVLERVRSSTQLQAAILARLGAVSAVLA